MKVLEFFKEDNGTYSAIRLVFILWSLGLLIIWCTVSIEKQKIQNLPDSTLTLLGLLLTSKVTQKSLEQNISCDDNK